MTVINRLSLNKFTRCLPVSEMGLMHASLPPAIMASASPYFMNLRQ